MRKIVVIVVSVALTFCCSLSAQTRLFYRESASLQDSSAIEQIRKSTAAHSDSLGKALGVPVNGPDIAVPFGSSKVVTSFRGDTLFLEKTEQEGSLQSRHSKYYWFNDRLHFYDEAVVGYILGKQTATVNWGTGDTVAHINGYECSLFLSSDGKFEVWVARTPEVPMRPPVNINFPKGKVVRMISNNPVTLRYDLVSE